MPTPSQSFQHPASCTDDQVRRAKKNFAELALNWLFGHDGPAAGSPQHKPSGSPTVIVEPPVDTSSWVDSFNAALTEATTNYIHRYVAPMHREDPSIGFSVTKVRVEIKDAALQCVRAIESMPIAMRNRIVQLRMKKALGSEQLMFDNFYGLSICTEETLIDGQLVQAMVSYSGARFMLKFEFDGKYDTLVPAGQPDNAPKANTGDELPKTVPPAPQEDVAEVAMEMPAELPMPQIRAARGTPVRTTPAPNIGKAIRETPMYIPAMLQRPFVAKLRLRSLGVEAEVQLFADGFPYTVGRHPEFSGYAVQAKCEADLDQPKLLQQAETPDFTSWVSRGHLTLDAYDAASREFDVSCIHGKNGTFLDGEKMSGKFSLSLASNDWLCLGGASGDGILEIKLEKA